MRYVALLLFVIMVACQPQTRPDPHPSATFGGTLSAFSSEKEFAAYLASFERPRPRQPAPASSPSAASPASSDDFMEPEEAVESMPMAEAAAPGNENITNVQEEGVDEGGIVKNIGNSLVILRRGRLYAVDVSGAQNRLTASIRVALDEHLNDDVWYDELLVRGRNIYVIGYRYLVSQPRHETQTLDWIHGATEIASFRLDEEGEIRRLGTGFLESQDYYDGDDYATRLIDGQFVMYKPFYGFDRVERLPRQLDYIGQGAFVAREPMMDHSDVMALPNDPQHDWPTLHTVIACDLPDDGTLHCDARGLISPEYFIHRYVSRANLYMYGRQHVVAFSLRSHTAAIHSVPDAMPTDRFAFSEKDGTLRIVVTRGGVITLLTLAISDFDGLGRQTVSGRELSPGYVVRQRWMGDWYVAQVRTNRAGRLLAFDAATERVNTREFPHQATRIDAMPGIGALIVYETAEGLNFDSLLFSDEEPPHLVEALRIENAREGESRSHGFFFRPNEHGGLFGLPILGSDGRNTAGSSSIAFFEAHRFGHIDTLGLIRANPSVVGQCDTSCYDWYGNTRPIFLRDRILALMGSELAEVVLEGGRIQEQKARVELRFD